MSAFGPAGRTEVPWERSAGLWLRAGAVAIGLVLVGAGAHPVPDALLLGSGAALGLFLLWRATPWFEVDVRVVLVVEPVLAMLVMLATGGWSSPYYLYLTVPVMFVALAWGRTVWALVAAATGLLVLHELVDADAVVAAEVSQVIAPLVIAAAIGVIGRRFVTQAEARHSQTLGRLQELSHANALLSTLYDLVRSTPVPLTVEDILSVIRDELDELFEADAVVLLIGDEAGRWWRPVHTEGASVAGEIAFADLPAPLGGPGPTTRPVLVEEFAEGTGLTPRARSGAYLWLWSRGSATGLLALEHNTVRTLPSGHRDMLERLSVPLSLAIDNAEWFKRLRTLGAEEERQRIGAQLHDRFAQSLVYIAGELDRGSRRHPDDEALQQLHRDVRTTLQDLRETLRELRLRCTEEHGLVPTLTEHLERFGERFGLITDLSVSSTLPRPPLPVENQLLRIAQDLVALAQREGGATSVAVRLSAEATRLRMVVTDDGRGIPEDALGAEATRVLSGVRDRAAAIGGLVDVFARPGEGSEVAVTVRGLL